MIIIPIAQPKIQLTILSRGSKRNRLCNTLDFWKQRRVIANISVRQKLKTIQKGVSNADFMRLRFLFSNYKPPLNKKS